MADTLSELRALEKAASPRLWTVEDTSGQTDMHGFGVGYTIRHGSHGHYGWDQADAAVAVAARNALPALLDVAEAAERLYRANRTSRAHGVAVLGAALAKLTEAET